MSGRLFLYASRIGCVIWGGGHAVRRKKELWHDLRGVWGHAVRGETGKWHDLRGVWGHAVRGGEGVWHDL